MTMTLAERLAAAPKLPAYTDALAPALMGLTADNDPMILLAAVATASRLALEHFTAQFRAAGGPVEAGRPYMVGERGPELIVPRLKAHVIPNHKLGGERAIRVDVTPSPYFDVRVTQISGQTVAQAVPAIVNASTRNTMDRANRRRLPGGLG